MTWNHNLHWARRTVPAGATRALDVGCGEGVLALELARGGVPTVHALDRDPRSLERARAADTEGQVTWIAGDLRDAPSLVPESYDMVTCVAVLHHLDAGDALRRMAALLAPGGTLVVVGLARRDGRQDLVRDGASAVAHRVLRARHGWWESGAPILLPPPQTYDAVEATARRVLGPGVVFRRRLLWRYTLVWTKT